MRCRVLLLGILLIACCQGKENYEVAKIREYIAGDFSRHDLVFKSAISRWDEAIPLGNGMMGILVWGDGQPLKLSLDRADLWDTRPVKDWQSPDYNYGTMRKWVEEGRIDDLHRLYESAYHDAAGPSKIPAGRIQIKFADNVEVKSSRLSLKTAIAQVQMNDGSAVRIFQHATEPVGMLSLCGSSSAPTFELITPPFSSTADQATRAIDRNDLRRLGYPSPKQFIDEQSQSFEQDGWGDFRFAIALKWKKKADESIEAAWSIATTNETSHPLELATERASAALKDGFEKSSRSHTSWWTEFWNQSRVAVPNQTVERQWYLDTYKFGCAARRGAPPITLQAIWTADEGKIPPWRGDYHHDLNTQLSYWPCYSGNHLEEGLSYLDWLWAIRPEARKWTQKFFNKPGLNVPMTSDIEGKQMGGWHQYTHSATTAAWLAHHFYLHWRYSMDRDFLRERAYPYLKEAATFLEAITEKDTQGKRFLRLSSSPEINDNRLDAWLPPTSNYDVALMRWLFAATAELAGELGYAEDRQHWLDVLAECPDLAFSPQDGRLLVAPGMPLQESHRHFSHLMAIHPLGLIQWENGEEDQKVIRGALDELDRLGTEYWCGYSFAWLASMAARGKDGERAEKALEIFAKAFCSQNSFHLNGDQTKSGYSKFTYRPFTLEGNMAAATGLQEMLLQSYDGVVRIFPAIPKSWQDVSFYHLRAEGAFLVSAKKEAGQIKQVEIVSEKGGDLRLENPFVQQVYQMQLKLAKNIERDDATLQFRCKPGAKILVRG